MTSYRYLQDGTLIAISDEGEWHRHPETKSSVVGDLEGRGNVCLKEVSDSGLRQALRPFAERRTCAICGKRRLGIPFRLLIERIGAAFRSLFILGDLSLADEFDDGTVLFWEHGNSAVSIVESTARVSNALARWVVESLSFAEKVGLEEEPFFAYPSALYVGKSAHPHQGHALWEAFCSRINSSSESEAHVCSEYLPRILGELEELRPPVFRVIDRHTKLYRARIASCWEQALMFERERATELAAPPAGVAKPGRMTLPGIPAFYATFAEHLAVAEVRPEVGDIVVTGEFYTSEPLRLLDLSRYCADPNLGSIYVGNYRMRAERATFLRDFYKVISYPLSPSLSERGYKPTQLMCQYVGQEYAVDGIVYPSCRMGSTRSVPSDYRSMNIALFNGPGLVEGDPRSSDRSAAPRLRLGLGSKHIVRSMTIGYEEIYDEPVDYLFRVGSPWAIVSSSEIEKRHESRRSEDDSTDRQYREGGARIDDFLDIRDSRESFGSEAAAQEEVLLGEEWEDDCPF